MSQPVTLTQVAIDLLNVAATRQPDERVYFSEARGIWQPNTWLLQRCWHTLARAGYAAEALTVADLARGRQALAPLQALHQLAQQCAHHPHLTPFLEAELQIQRARLLLVDESGPTDAHPRGGKIEELIDQLLYFAAAAAYLPDRSLVFTCLERLDQLARAWDRIFVQPDKRLLLAETVSRVGLHPLTAYLIDAAIRRFSDSGAQFLQQLAGAIARQKRGDLATLQQRVLERCATALRNATLLTLHSRRIAATVMAQAGRFDEVIAQLDTIATIQDAHRETGHAHHAQRSSGAPYTVSTYTSASYASSTQTKTRFDSGAQLTAPTTAGNTGERDGVLLRQVTRARADTDVDFLVHTLQNVIDVLPRDELLPAQAQVLSQRLTALSGRSDGWTAAGAVTALLKLGDIASAIAVTNGIAPQDPTRSEVLIALVQGLLAGGHTTVALEQVHRAMEWARSLEERTPERALTWGLAAAFLNHGRPDVALQLLGESPEPTWGERLRQLLRGQWPGGIMTDDTLRTDRLRLQAQLDAAALETNGAAESSPASSPELSPDTDALVRRLWAWAPQLLEGETLVNFYVDGVLRPLLRAGKVRHAWGLLPQLQEALLDLRGAKHAAQIARVLQLLTDPLNPDSAHYNAAHVDAMRTWLEKFALALWQEDAEHGIWQTVYGVEGTLALLLQLEGPDAVLDMAHAAATEGAVWMGE